MGDSYTPQETEFLMAEQALFGTAIADDAAASWNLLHGEGSVIEKDVINVESKTDRGFRYPDVYDSSMSENGAMPKVTIPEMVLRKDIAAPFLYSFFQAVTEGETTPYSKVFTIPVGIYPDFSDDEGKFLNFMQVLPVASTSHKVNDCICQHLHLKVVPRGALMMNADFVGRGAVSTVANPTATVVRAPQDYYRWELMALPFTYEIGAGNITPEIWSIDLDFAWEVVPTGTDGAGNFQNFLLQNFTGKLETSVTWDANTKLLFAAYSAGTEMSGSFGWGNATPGTVDGDLHFAYRGILDTSTLGKDVALRNNIIVNLAGDSENSQVPITITMADAIDRTY